MKEIKHVAMMPLIGGFAIAAEQELNRKPEFILSYPVASWNDSQYLNNNQELKDKYIVLEDNTNEFVNPDDKEKFNKLNKDIDIVTCISFCSGLSMLNASTNKDSDKARGSDAVQNRFMYLTADFALKNIKPKVFIFENAPALYTNSGAGVFDNLVEIAKKYGYSFSAMKTTTLKHGIPQNRTRSFGFLWKSEYAPILNYYDTPYKTISEYLREMPKDLVYNDIKKATDDFNSNSFLSFLMKEEGPNFRKNILKLIEHKKTNSITACSYLIHTKKLEKMLEYLGDDGCKTTKKLVNHIINKIKMGKGWWDSSPIIIDSYINAVISKNAFRYVHPNENRFLTLRECMWLMGIPHNFELISTKAANTITQNVPVNTARDMIKECVKFINGDLNSSFSPVVKQNNIGKRIDFPKNVKPKNSFYRFIK